VTDHPPTGRARARPASVASARRPLIASPRRHRIQASALSWFDRRGRRFAFRGPRDPYLVLVSEVILQQTQVSRGEPAWRSFTARFPSFEALAEAPTADVLRAWSGLGYNRRAVSLQRTARIVVERHGGTLPDELTELERLPGIGRYTARAVSAVCFGRPVGPVDTNVRRVLSRLVGRASIPTASLQALADTLVPPERPGDWSAALMDIGATICRPRGPDCPVCPLAADCRSAGRVVAVPVRATHHTISATGVAPPRASGVTSSGDSGPRSPRGPAPFPATRRWLRGRIVERLSKADDGWQIFDAPIGTHDRAAVAEALVGLEADGLLERDATGRVRLPGARVRPSG
jgi:A/G-specific adenine glycosylase